MENSPETGKPAARIYCLIAPKARKAVILRRGPSKQVRMLAWDLKTDRIDPGQWLKGRVYERRCDLSPDGTLFAYFAAHNRPPVYSWTAVSRPPDFTALSFFPKGDAWGGGGLFADNRTLRLNHFFETPVPASKPKLKKSKTGRVKRVPRYQRQAVNRPWEKPESTPSLTAGSQSRDERRNALNLKIAPLGRFSGGGEDGPIETMRFKRDGWTLSDRKHKQIRNNDAWSSGVWITYDPPVPRTKAIPGKPIRLQVTLHGVGERQGRWNVETMELVCDTDLVDLGRIDWADLDHNGDILYSASGKLFRMKARVDGGHIKTDCREVADVNAMRFEAIPPRPENL